MKNNENIIVFLSGPDRCGKTEITKELSKRLGLPRYKASTEHAGFLNDHDRFIHDIRYSCPARLDLLQQMGTGVIYDRGYPCEWVYSRFFGRQTDDNAITWLDEQYSLMNARIIIPLRRSYAGIVDDLNPEINETSLQRISDLYEEFIKISKCNVKKIYVDDEDLDREIREIIGFIEETKKR